MIRRIHRYHGQRHTAEPEHTIVSRRESRRSDGDENLDVARCPVCGHQLIARQDCRGPYFFCLCVKRRAA